jgi:hypothetical protein
MLHTSRRSNSGKVRCSVAILPDPRTTVEAKQPVTSTLHVNTTRQAHRAFTTAASLVGDNGCVSPRGPPCRHHSCEPQRRQVSAISNDDSRRDGGPLRTSTGIRRVDHPRRTRDRSEGGGRRRRLDARSPGFLLPDGRRDRGGSCTHRGDASSGNAFESSGPAWGRPLCRARQRKSSGTSGAWGEGRMSNRPCRRSRVQPATVPGSLLPTSC